MTSLQSSESSFHPLLLLNFWVLVDKLFDEGSLPSPFTGPLFSLPYLSNVDFDVLVGNAELIEPVDNIQGLVDSFDI